MSGNWKIDIWKYGLYVDALGDSFAQRPHNDFLWVFAEGGFIAGLSYILLFLILLRDSYFLYRNRQEDSLFYALLFSCFLGYTFISLLDFPMERISHNIIFFLLASFVIAGRLTVSQKIIPKSLIIFFLIFSFLTMHMAFIRYKGEVYATDAMHYKLQGKWSYVVKSIDKAYNSFYYEMENTSTPLSWYKGVALFNQAKYDEALKDFKDAYKINPFHVHVLNNLATCFQIQGDSEKAKKYYKDVFKLNPSFKESRVNLAAILYNEKKYVEALDVILLSNAGKYIERKNNNFQDNYDLYLKTIVISWVNSLDDLNDFQIQLLNQWVSDFENQPRVAAKNSMSIFQIRKDQNVDYLTALVLFGNKE